MQRISIYFGLVLLLLWSCAPTRYVKTLDKGQHAIQGNFGGPMAKVPGIGVIPIPFTSVGYGYGLTDKTTIFGNLHMTSLLFGVGQTDFGVSQNIWKNERMGVSIQPEMNILVDFYTGANRFWPQLDANYYFDYKSGIRDATYSGEKGSVLKVNSLYGGISNWFDPYMTESQGRKNQQLWIPSIQIGHLWQRNNWNYNLEFKLLAPIYSNKNIVVDYPSVLGNYGAMGIYFGVTYRFKK
jgi:hypothetical protein